jgi:hypothetical protein
MRLTENVQREGTDRLNDLLLGCEPAPVRAHTTYAGVRGSSVRLPDLHFAEDAREDAPICRCWIPSFDQPDGSPATNYLMLAMHRKAAEFMIKLGRRGKGLTKEVGRVDKAEVMDVNRSRLGVNRRGSGHGAFAFALPCRPPVREILFWRLPRTVSSR